MDEGLARCIKIIDEMQAEIDRLQNENLWLRNDRNRLILVNALRVWTPYKPSRGRKRKYDKEKLDVFPEFLEMVKSEYGFKYDKDAYQFLIKSKFKKDGLDIEKREIKRNIRTEARRLQIAVSKNK